jgi:hypothetical protein
MSTGGTNSPSFLLDLAPNLMRIKNNKIQDYSDFWNWFKVTIQSDGFQATNPEFFEALNGRIDGLDTRLSWEIGPGLKEDWLFALSPNLNKELWPLTIKIISQAPSIKGWEFYTCRQPKQWTWKFEYNLPDSATISIDASNWTFVLLRYPNGDHEIIICGSGIQNLHEDDKWQVAAIVLEGALGEEILLEAISSFELVESLEPRFAVKAKPIQELRGKFANFR